jgi:nucleoid DNA-binding protein
MTRRDERKKDMAKAKKKAAATGKPRTKSDIYAGLADSTGLTKKEIGAVFEGLSALIKKDLGSRGPGVFSVPGLVKLKRVVKPATKARKGINPFTKEEMMFKAKPARKVVKAQPLKALKDMV